MRSVREEFDGSPPGYDAVVVGYAEEGIEGVRRRAGCSNADGVSYCGMGCVGGTLMLWPGGVIIMEAIGVR